jgi:hypothetical protein
MNDRISVPTTAAAELCVTVDSRKAIAAIAISGMKYARPEAPITHAAWVSACYAVPAVLWAFVAFVRRDVAG